MTRQTRSFSLFLSSPLTIFILISVIEIYLPPVLLKPPEWQLLFSGSPQPIYSPDNEVQAVCLLLCFPAFGSPIFHLKKASQRRLHAEDRDPGLRGGFPAPAALAALPLRASISEDDDGDPGRRCRGPWDPSGMLLPIPQRVAVRLPTHTRCCRDVGVPQTTHLLPGIKEEH